ncbi:MAG: cyclic nucleotide-gated ion channel [Minwuia sp.]|uniref:cyclic nucleotide-gated ion channel n=1 Tax=Minwuia sp. TaxID=2493630 RepID=UPI003A8948BC
MLRRASEEKSVRRRIFEIVEEAAPGDRPSAIFDWFLITLISINIAAVVLETVPSIHDEYEIDFLIVEWVSVIIFTVEYLLRLWVAPEHPSLRRLGPVRSRLRYAISFQALVDLAAVLPFYLSHVFGIDLRILRVLRLLRFLKLMRYSSAMMTMQRVIYDERRALLASLLIMLGLLIMASTAMYYAEHNAQPEVFGSIPAAMWWGLATLTTVGYGDLVPHTLAGKMIGGVVMLIGLGMFALPIGILATGFTQEVHRREFVVTRSMVGRIALFADLPPGEIARLTRLFRAVRFEIGTAIERRGEAVDEIHFIAVGEVEVVMGESSFRLGEGDVFGESALLKRVEDDLTAITSSQCLIMSLDLRDINALITREPSIGEKLGEIAARRIPIETDQ